MSIENQDWLKVKEDLRATVSQLALEAGGVETQAVVDDLAGEPEGFPDAAAILYLFLELGIEGPVIADRLQEVTEQRKQREILEASQNRRKHFIRGFGGVVGLFKTTR